MIHLTFTRQIRTVGLALMLFLTNNAKAQTSQTLLSPTGDGGFETGTTFAANGWTVQNYSYFPTTTTATSAWFVGATSVPSNGARAAYVSNDINGATHAYNRYLASRIMFWRDITFPAGYTQVTLSFKIKVNGKASYDDLSVFFQSGATVPAVTEPLATTTANPTITNTTLIANLSMLGTSYVTQTYTLNAGNATTATTRRIIFYWENTISTTTGTQPPPSIDEISIVATNPCISPVLSSFADTFRCGAGAVTLNAAAAGSASVKWYTAATSGTAIFTGTSFTTPSLSANTNYYITAINGTCESSPRQMVTANIRPVPVVHLGNDTTICPGVAYTFNAGNAGGTYLWSSGETTQTVTKNAVGTYSVKATVNSCSGGDTITITPGITPVNTLPDTTNLCNGSTAILDAGNTGFYYVWSPGGATTQAINATAEGPYNVNIKSVDGCKINSNTYLKIRPLPVNNLGNDTIICSGTSLLLNAGNNGYSYLWNTGAHTQTINSSDSGNYEVTVTSPYGCQHLDDMHIAFTPSPKTEGFSFIPKFFEALGKVDFSPLNPTHVNGYVWNFGDGSASIFTQNATHTYNAPGNYMVTLMVYNDCDTFTISQQIYVALAGGGTGVTTIQSNQFNISIYPNPANRLLNIKGESPDVMIKEISVYNAAGALIYRHQATTSNVHQIEVDALANGLYNMRIETNKGFVNRIFQVLK